MREGEEQENIAGDGVGGILLGFGALILAMGLLLTAALFTSPSFTIFYYSHYYVDRDFVALSLLVDSIGLTLTVWGYASSRSQRRRRGN